MNDPLARQSIQVRIVCTVRDFSDRASKDKFKPNR